MIKCNRRPRRRARYAAIEYGLIAVCIALAIITVANGMGSRLSAKIRLDQLFAALIVCISLRGSITTTISAATIFAAALSRIGRT